MRKTPTLLIVLAMVIAACTSDGTGPAPEGATTITSQPSSQPPAGTNSAASDGESATSDERNLGAALAASDLAEPGLLAEHEGIVSYAAPHFRSDSTDPTEAAFAYFREFSGAYGVADVDARLEVTRTWASGDNTVVRFQQTIDGLPVFAGEISVLVGPDGTVIGVSGVVVPDAGVPESSLTADQAADSAVAAIPGAIGVEGAAIAVAVSGYVDGTEADPIPGWDVTVVTSRDGIDFRDTVIIDGSDGSVLMVAGLDIDGIDFDVHDADNAVNDDGDGTTAEAELVLEYRDGEITEYDGVDETARTLSSHLAASWQYYLDTHGRDGHDDAGSPCTAYVHYGNEWRNASAGRGCVHRYGDARPYAESLDVVAHEFTHDVTRATAGLIYEGQSGALNEHYSDFFAAMVDRSDWDLFGIRDLSNPARDSIDEFLLTEEDKGGVHSNSGIPNRAGYMVATGDATTHPDSGIEVQGIGRAKAEQLWYATLLSLSPRTNLGAWACATYNMAVSMEGDLLTADDVESVFYAMVAVGLIIDLPDDKECRWFTGGAALGDPSEPGPDATTTTTLPSEEACSIVGVWRLQDDLFFSEIQRLAGGQAVAVELRYFAGDYWLELREDGTLRDHRDDWGFRVDSPDGALVTLIQSEIKGTYSTNGDSITATLDEGEADVFLFVEIDGELQALPMGFNSGQTTTIEPVLDGSGTFQCLGDELRVTTNTENGPMEAAWDRVG